MKPIICPVCGTEFKPQRATRVYCSNQCSQRGRTRQPADQEKTLYLVTIDRDHPLAQTRGLVKINRKILYDKIGPGPHPCHWCNRELDWIGVGGSKCVADHLDGDTHNNDPANLVPSCHRCNTNRGRRDDYLTHCPNGHERSPENTYVRPDGDGTQCRVCIRVSRGRPA